MTTCPLPALVNYLRILDKVGEKDQVAQILLVNYALLMIIYMYLLSDELGLW